MRILAVNWLDRENPQAGGAEIHFFEIFRRLVERGHEVTLVASGWKGAAPTAVIDGLQVHRFGGRHSFALRGRRAVGAEVDILGQRFEGATRAVHFGGAPARIILWGDGRVRVGVPRLDPGYAVVVLTVDGRPSNAISFQVE